MGVTIIDKRPAGSRTSESRERFFRRLRNYSKNFKVSQDKVGSSAPNARTKNLEEEKMLSDISRDDVILSGNEEFTRGDEIEISSSSSGGSQAGSGETDLDTGGEELFAYLISDWELPNKVSEDGESDEFKLKRSGYQKSGSFARLAIKRSYLESFARRMAQEKILAKRAEDLEILGFLEEAEKLRSIKVPFMIEDDLRFISLDKKPMPSFSAIMFCIMDISGSMVDHHRSLAKQFFSMLYHFLKIKYHDKIELVFVCHGDQAYEVDEDVFFRAITSGGTIISKAYELLLKIYESRYSGRTNIYVAQATDGDNWTDPPINDLLDKVISLSRFFILNQVDSASYTKDTEFISLFKSKQSSHVKYISSTDEENLFSRMDSVFRKGA